MHILYIEDNPNDARLVERYIETTTNQLTIVRSAHEAEALLAHASTFALIMIDIVIDNAREGYAIASQLRRQGYAQPLVAVTALNTPKEEDACYEAGFSAILTKPFMITALTEMLAQYS